MGRKIAIIFPGVGYHTDKPLLYFGKKLAKEKGYEVIEVPYTGFATGIRGNQEKMKEAFETAYTQAEEILRPYSISDTDEVLIFSKSVGTVVAGAWQKRHEIRGKNIYFTPVEATFSFLRPGSGIVFHGTFDPWVKTAIVEEFCEKLSLPLYKTNGADHSMETGNIQENIQILQSIFQMTEAYLGES